MMKQTLKLWIEEYLHYCEFQKKLDRKTLKAYRIDLSQFDRFIQPQEGGEECSGKQGSDYPLLNKKLIEAYIKELHQKYKGKSVKRKITVAKSFFLYLEYQEILEENPFAKLQIKFREEKKLPKAMTSSVVEGMLRCAYAKLLEAQKKERSLYRDIAVLELLFATGIRVSELCNLKKEEIDINTGNLIINGKGSKERLIQICNSSVLRALKKYEESFAVDMEICGHYFVNRLKHRLSEQSVRNMISKYAKEAKIGQHITPHMFRHSFATLLLEADVDIRYIQAMLGHASISTTQIYTHVAAAKQREILRAKHPRNSMDFDQQNQI